MLKNIIYIQAISSYAPAWGMGGPVRLMFDYSSWLVKQNIKVCVLTGNVADDFTKSYTKSQIIDNISIQRFRVYLKRLVPNGITIISPLYFYKLFQLARNSNKKVVIHLGEYRSLVSIYVLLIKLIFKKKIFLMHSPFGQLNASCSKIRRIYDFIFEGLFFRSIDLALVQNTHEADIYKHYLSKYIQKYNDKVVLLPLHVKNDDIKIFFKNFSDAKQIDHTAGKSLSIKEKLRAKYDYSSDEKILIFLGRFHESKGIIRLINTFNRLVNLDFNIKYRLLIIGHNHGFLPNIEDHICILGLQNSINIIQGVTHDRFEYYYLSDLFVGFPVVYEETMLASVEALMLGTPIIVSKEADLPNVTSSNAGKVISYNENNSMNEILSVLNSQLEYESNALSCGILNFSDTSIEKSFISIISDRV